jgi:hypothetical protein
MVIYGNHLKTATWLDASNMITYDYGVMGKFEHMLSTTKENPNPNPELVLYIKECKEILELDYGVTKVSMLLCSWAETRARGSNVAMKKDKFGFTLVHFKRLLP